ncbi:MAG: TIGR03118 family protein, partial [Pirellulales bacterium]
GSFAPFTTSGGFAATVPVGFAPYNIANLNGLLYVTYALQGLGSDAVAGAGQGFVDVFDYNGNFQKTLIPLGGALDAPWGIAQAPASFGDFSGDLLVANHGDGLIHAFNTQTGTMVGTMTVPSGGALSIAGLRGLAFGNGVSTGGSNELLFSAGPGGGAHGLLGAIQSAQGVTLTAQGSVVTTTANQSFNGTLAVFSDAQNLSPGSFTATINWGDGTTSSAGDISALADGGYAVSGSHTYNFGGTKSITIQIHDSLGDTASANAVAQVAVAGVSATGLTFAPTEGATFSGAVATFTDGDGNTSTLPYHATIVWGDGATSAATVSFTTGEFTVSGSHAYADEATKSVSVTVNDMDGTSATAISTAKIADAPLSGTATAIADTLGALFDGTVATFTDGNPQGSATDFTATVDWGDGNTTAGTVTAGTGGTFTVAGSHAFIATGTQTVKVTINDVGGSQTVATDSATVTDIDVLVATLVNIAPTQGTLFSAAVAAVVDTNLATLAGQLAATIDWGDGTATSGTVSGALGVFAVTGNHTYIGEGDEPLSVTVSHIGGTATATAVATITVADSGSLLVTGVAIAATEGATFSGALATASDTFAAPASVFSATIDWGDDTSSDATVSGPNGLFTISGTHAYAEDGTYAPVVTIADLSPGTISATGTLSAVVADAPISASSTTFNSTEGQAFAGSVATFSDDNLSGTAADFTATIDWGDGTVSGGTVSGAGGFTVGGTHTYTVGGTYTATVTIDDVGGSSAVAKSQALIADYPLTATGVPISAAEGQPFSGVVAAFSDTNPDGGNLADFFATIIWGDGGTTTGAITGSGGNYTVSGAYTFADVSNAVVIIVNDVGGASATTTASASVADANTLTPLGATIAATEGQTWSGALATFADSYSGNPAGDFSVAVDWGDGQTSDATVAGQGGQFTVSGHHVYAEAGTYSATVILEHNAPGTASATADSKMSVADAGLTASGATLTGTEGSTFSGVVASFVDANTLSTATDFTAMIAWGDGTPN